MKHFKSTLVLEESDVDDYQPIKGFMIDLLLVPITRKEAFYDSKAWKAVFPMLLQGPVIFYEVNHEA